MSKKICQSPEKNKVRQGNPPEFYQALTLFSFIFYASKYIKKISILISFCIVTVCITWIQSRIEKKKKGKKCKTTKKMDPFPNLVAFHTDSSACTRGQRKKK